MEFGGATTEISPADHALDQIDLWLTRLTTIVDGGGLDSADDSHFVGFMQAYERMRRRLPLIDHRVIRDATDRGLPEKLTQPSMQRVLTSTLRVSRAEAGRRVRAAEQLGERVSMLGEVLSPHRPVLAAAQADGAVSTEQANIIVSGLAKVDRPGFDPADVDAAEELLTGFAGTFGPEDLKRLADTVVDRIDPDGSRPRDDLNHDRRNVELRPCADGTWVGEMRLTGPVGSKLQALLRPLAKPRVGTVMGADGKPMELVDTRTYGQRMHDALEDLCDRLLRAGDLPDSGGTPATVIITIDLDDLLARTGYGTTSDGTLIATREVLSMASEAEIIPAVLNSSGAVLNLGRSRRIASRTQTLALIARDVGCSFPGCAHPPEWCERHHIREWADGGLTDLNNLTLLCGYHHRNFASRGWVCRINVDGLPEWIPPKHVDRAQVPLINTRIVGRLAQRRFAKASDDRDLRLSKAWAVNSAGRFGQHHKFSWLALPDVKRQLIDA